MKVIPRTSKEILRDSVEILRTAKFGMSLVNSADPGERRIGIRNVIVFGRSVTIAVQNLRSVETAFEEWYEPWVTRMKADPVMGYLKTVRNEILKEGNLRTSLHMSGSFNSTALQPLMKDPPPGAKGFFVGDPSGGSGWEVAMPNGEIEKYYISLNNIPGIDLTMRLHFAGAPEELQNKTIAELCEHYLDELTMFVEDANTRFGN
jgi:hypothetical protein